jgi:ABC-type uncharacterized transport system permease subunit
LILLYVAVAALYALRCGCDRPACPPPPSGLVALALVVHAVVIVRAVFAPDGIDLSFPQALSLVAWLTVLVATLSGCSPSCRRSGASILPCAGAVRAGAAVRAVAPHRFAYAGETWAAIHIAVALVGYALFTVAALQALLLTGLEKRLHSGIARPRRTATCPSSRSSASSSSSWPPGSCC